MGDPEYTVEQIPVARTYALRQAVLRPGRSLDEVSLADDSLPTTVAFGAVTADDEVIGIARVSREAPPFQADANGWRLRSMATRPAERGRGVGSAILDVVIAHCAANGGGTLWCSARLGATGLYARAGMQSWGEVWEEPEIGPHIIMWRHVQPRRRLVGFCAMADSPIRALMSKLDALDLDGAILLFAPEATFSSVFGAEVTGPEQIRAEINKVLTGLRSSTHELDAEWNPQPGAWVAKLTATYELSDYSRLGPYKRAAFVHAGDSGIETLEFYGAHEVPSSGSAYQEVRGPHGWLPSL